MSRIDIAFDRRTTSHMSLGMTTYTRKLEALLPQVAPDLCFAFVGEGDNFDRAEQLDLPFTLARLRPRLAHIPTPFAPLLMPVPFVLTIHDLIDLEYPQFGKRRVGPYFRYGVGPLARRARVVITDDDATIGALHAHLGVDPTRVRVVALGVDAPVAAPVAPCERPYFLNVGNHRPHKNVAALVRAWAHLPAELEVDLLLTGTNDVGDAFVGLQRERGNLVFLGTRSDAELMAYYQAAAAYVHPALREGFGLPLLEAMRAGTPVIAAHGALPRVLAPHAYAFEPDDSEELGELLRSALTDPATFRRGASAAQAATAELTWERTASATAAIYRELLA